MAGLDVTHEGTQVRVSARAAYDTLEKLAAKAAPRATPTTIARPKPAEK